MTRPSVVANTRLKRAETTSAIGAGILGAGIGILFGATLQPFGIPALLLGLVMHAWGMFDKHRLETDAVLPRVWWVELLYWVCWVTLVALLAAVVARLV
jgi:hypothetical protein